ncbi:MAG: hypothetical protein ACREV7_00190 [Steroidobacteraceae bacterium]
MVALPFAGSYRACRPPPRPPDHGLAFRRGVAAVAGLSDDINLDCSPRLMGMSVEEAGRRIFDALIAVAAGAPTKSEARGSGDHELVPWQL